MSSKILPFDCKFVTQSVNYHGHNLLKHLVSENAAQIHTIKLQDIDYKVNQSRAAEIRNLGPRAQEIIKFIASKSDCLLVGQPHKTAPPDHEDNTYKDRYNHQLPIEYFLNVSKGLRISSFFEIVKQGDLIFASVHSLAENTCFLKFIAFDGGKHRYLNDITSTDIKLLMRSEDTIVSSADEDRQGRWLKGTKLRVEVMSVFYNSGFRTVLVGTKGVTLTEKTKNKVHLGKVNVADIPPILSSDPDVSITHLSHCIEKMESFKNPQCIKDMALQMNIDLRSYPSLMQSLRGKYQECDMAPSLRKVQMCKWAHKSVADGVTYFKKGHHEEAFQCLNKALQIDPENVEAFVAKGALLANMGRYEKAVEDFEKSLKYNPNHVNARKYMCETLVELGKQMEENDKLEEAEKCYKKCLDVNKDHEGAKEALKSVAKKLGNDMDLLKLLINEEPPKIKEDDFFSDLLEMEIEFKKKRSDESVPEFKKIQLKVSPKEQDPEAVESAYDKAYKVTERAPSLSPLSLKMSMQQNLWAPPPDINQTLSFLSQPPPNLHDPTIHNSGYSMYNNPPPQPSQWPFGNSVQPPPGQYESSSAPPGFSEDPQYKARVDQFLKQLESRSLTVKQRNRSKERSVSKKRDLKKRNKRARKSSSGSSKSRSRSRSSSSSSKSSSSSSSSSSESDDKRSKKKRKKKNSKKTKMNKKPAEKIPVKEPTPEVAIPSFEDLEKKLQAYYKKMEAIQDGAEILPVAFGNKSLSPKNEIKKKNTQKEGKIEEAGILTAPVLSTNQHKLASKLSLNTHPAFMDGESEEEEDRPKMSSSKKMEKLKAAISGVISIPIKEKLVVKPLEKSKTKKKRVSASSSSRSNSRSSSRSSQSTSSKSRSQSRSRSRSRSYSKSRRRKSRSKDSYNHRSRQKNSRLRDSYRSRSRSRGLHRTRSRSRDLYRTRSRSRDSYRRRSRSRGAYHRKSRSKDSYRRRSRSRDSNHRRSKSPRFGYYDNKPVYNYKKRELARDTTVRPNLSYNVTKFDKDRKALSIGENAKQKIHKHLSLQAIDISKKVAKNGKTKKITNDKDEKINQNSDSKKEKKTSDVFPKAFTKKSGSIPTSTARFGKWAKEQEDKDAKNEGANNGIAEEKIKAPVGSLDQFENFLKIAKEKKLNMMKERNRAFLKPKVE